MIRHLSLLLLTLLISASDSQPLRAEGISTLSPISNLLSANPSSKPILRRLTNLFSQLEQSADGPQSENRKHVCIQGRVPWRLASNAFIRERGWGLTGYRHCYVDFSDGIPLGIHPQVFEEVRALGGIVDSVAGRAARDTGRDWKHAEAPVAFPFENSALRCEVDGVTAFKVSDKWYVTVSITNAPSMHYLPDNSRLFIEEYVRVEGDEITPAVMSLPHITDTGIQNRTDSTTLQSTWDWAGAVIPVKFGRVLTEDIPSVRNALQAAGLHVQQIEAALTKSNLAIISLPLLLTLVPIALVADVDGLSTLFYAILSDVLTVLPMAIKGFELVTLSGTSFRSVVVRMGPPRENQTTASEMWLASCGLRDVRGVGITLLAVAGATCLLGISLDVFAKSYVDKRSDAAERRGRERETGFEQGSVLRMKCVGWDGLCPAGRCLCGTGRRRRKRKRELP